MSILLAYAETALLESLEQLFLEMEPELEQQLLDEIKLLSAKLVKMAEDKLAARINNG